MGTRSLHLSDHGSRGERCATDYSTSTLERGDHQPRKSASTLGATKPALSSICNVGTFSMSVDNQARTVARPSLADNAARARTRRACGVDARTKASLKADRASTG